MKLPQIRYGAPDKACIHHREFSPTVVVTMSALPELLSALGCDQVTESAIVALFERGGSCFSVSPEVSALATTTALRELQVYLTKG